MAKRCAYSSTAKQWLSDQTMGDKVLQEEIKRLPRTLVLCVAGGNGWGDDCYCWLARASTGKAVTDNYRSVEQLLANQRLTVATVEEEPACINYTKQVVNGITPRWQNGKFRKAKRLAK